MAVRIDVLQKQIENKNNEIEKLKSELLVFKKSPYYTSYTTILNQVNDFCEKTKISLDINDPENKEAFNMRWKFIQELPQLLINLDTLREKMTPAEQRLADKLRDDSLVESRAEKWKRD